MLYRVGADLVLFAHLFVAAFAVFGGLVVSFDPAGDALAYALILAGGWRRAVD